MKVLFLALFIANVFLFGLGAGWFGIVPSDMNMGAGTKAPIEFKPQSIHFIQAQ